MCFDYCCLDIGKLLTHWGWVTHICISKLTIIGSDNGVLNGWHLAIIWTNTGIFLMGTLGTNFSEILSEIDTFSLKKCNWKVVCKMAAILSLPQCDCMIIAHSSLNIVANILQTIFSIAFSWNKIFRFEVSLKLKSSLDNNSALVQAVAGWTGPPLLTWFNFNPNMDK